MAELGAGEPIQSRRASAAKVIEELTCLSKHSALPEVSRLDSSSVLQELAALLGVAPAGKGPSVLAPSKASLKASGQVEGHPLLLLYFQYLYPR